VEIFFDRKLNWIAQRMAFWQNVFVAQNFLKALTQT
jgi:hypothetical protein